MANKQNKTDFAPESKLVSIETLQARHKLPQPVYAGVCAANGWKSGRAMTEADFLRAVADFTGAPMHARQGKG